MLAYHGSVLTIPIICKYLAVPSISGCHFSMTGVTNKRVLSAV